jgi:histidine triad (HIT) family protein
MDSHCPFCSIVAGTLPASIVCQDDLCCAFMDINPINPGHALVVPIRHAAGLAELDSPTGAQLFTLARRLASAQRSSLPDCSGVNLFLADGKAAGQEVFHVHLHVIPRRERDGVRFQRGAGSGGPVNQEALTQIAKSLADDLSGFDSL